MFSSHKLFKEIGRLFRFGLTGVISALIFAIGSFTIVELEAASPIIATIIAYFIAAMFSYFVHLRFTFGVVPDHRAYFPRFLFTAITTFSLTVLLTWLIIEYWLGPFYLALTITTLSMPAISYACYRLWVYYPGLKS